MPSKPMTLTVEHALSMAGRTTWASHSREQVDAAVAALAAEVVALTCEVERLQAELGKGGGPCATCANKHTPYMREAVCRLTQMSDGVHPTTTYVPCRFLGGGCRAWQARKETPCPG